MRHSRCPSVQCDTTATNWLPAELHELNERRLHSRKPLLTKFSSCGSPSTNSTFMNLDTVYRTIGKTNLLRPRCRAIVPVELATNTRTFVDVLPVSTRRKPRPSVIDVVASHYSPKLDTARTGLNLTFVDNVAKLPHGDSYYECTGRSPRFSHGLSPTSALQKARFHHHELDHLGVTIRASREQTEGSQISNTHTACM